MLINKISLIQVDYEQSFFFSAVHNLSGSNQLKKLILAHSRKFMEGLRYHGSSEFDFCIVLTIKKYNGLLAGNLLTTAFG